jgi:DNA topoisomerase IB
VLEPTSQAVEAALDAGLRYVCDGRPGISRRRRGRGFAYLDRDGAPVTDERTLARIRALAVPPAWSDVWICPMENGHLQATGRDARGRKQYRYHARWREAREEAKYDRMLDFGRALPRIRRRAARDLRRRGLPRERVLAAVTLLLEGTLIRVGNQEYAQANATVLRAIETVAARLGNTPAVCRRCYIHPEVIAAYLDGSLAGALDRSAGAGRGGTTSGLRPEEGAVLALLRRRLATLTTPVPGQILR